MKRRTLVLVGTGAAAAMLGAAVRWWRSEPQQASSDAVESLFAATLVDADGVAQSLAQWRGRPLVVNFWATWCPPCVEEMPDLQQVRDEFRAKGVEVIGLGIDSAAKIVAFRDKYRLTLPLLVAGAGGSDLYRMLGNSGGVLPYTVLIGADGRVRERQVGQVKPEQLRRWLSEAIR